MERPDVMVDSEGHSWEVYRDEYGRAERLFTRDFSESFGVTSSTGIDYDIDYDIDVWLSPDDDVEIDGDIGEQWWEQIRDDVGLGEALEALILMAEWGL